MSLTEVTNEQRRAYVTLLTMPSYLAGTLVLHHCLQRVNAKYPLIVMVSPKLPQSVRDILTSRNIEIIDVGHLDPAHPCTTSEDQRFQETWTKLRVFELIGFERVVLLDSDMLIRKNMDELFDVTLNPGWVGAAHACACNPRKLAHYPIDWIPSNCAYTSPIQPVEITESSPRPYGLLNSGMVVLTPDLNEFARLKAFIDDSPLTSTFLFADQDVLSELFKGRWKPLSYVYNALKTLRVVHSVLWRDDDVKCIHYILADKPWKARPKLDGTGGEYEDVHLWWWDALELLKQDMIKEGSSEEVRKAWAYVESTVASA